jgi:hypothetical protein
LFGIIHKGGTKLGLHVGKTDMHVGNAGVISLILAVAKDSESQKMRKDF